MTQSNPSSSDSRPNPPAQAAAKAPAGGGVKETLESILVAFILAFIFRAFIVEAFVIPTGSMAPTLLGAHMRFDCRDCGYRFDVSYDKAGQEMNIPDRAYNQRFRVYCPNCGYLVPGGPNDQQTGDATAPPIRYGDRILVLKYLYLLQDPQRWDVVVFKSPADPQEYHYTQNYIKRLVGLPGETVMILDGDIYVATRDVPTEQLTPEDFTVQTKPPHVQNALWRIVYDNDYHPQGLVPGRWTQPWQQQPGGSGWNLGSTHADGRAFTFSNLDGAGAIAFNPFFANRRTGALTDWLGYNQASLQQSDLRQGEYVGDLKLQFIYHRHQGDGALRLMLGKRDDLFIAQLTPDAAQLLHARGDQPPQPVGQPVPLPSGKSLKIEFQNVDYQVTLRVNGRVLIQTTPHQYRPDVAQLLQTLRDPGKPPVVGIEADRQVATIEHISLWRDVYYLDYDAHQHRRLWASPRGEHFTDLLFRLDDKKGNREYFVLGDNSLISGDARYWLDPIDLPHENLHVEAGRIPERFLLGKAFFVYWPAGYPPFPGVPHLIPNFGEMRFIH